MTYAKAARILGISTATIRRMLASSELISLDEDVVRRLAETFIPRKAGQKKSDCLPDGTGFRASSRTGT